MAYIMDTIEEEMGMGKTCDIGIAHFETETTSFTFFDEPVNKIVSLLLSYTAVDVNAINKQGETALDLADKLPYGDSALERKEDLAEFGAKYARHVGEVDEAMELKRTVSDIKHEVQ